MKNRIYSLCIACFLCVSLMAQVNSNVLTAKTPEQLGGVYYAYPTGEKTSSFVIQPSAINIVPFYISHYGRHGSRWLPDDSRYIWVNEQFEDVSNLTKLGKSVRKRLKKVWKNAQGNGGKLTPLGASQHQGIAQRMMARYPQVFQDNIRMIARSSTVDRCRKSMLAFTDEIRRQLPDKLMSVETNEADMRWLVHNTSEVKDLEKRTKVYPRISPNRFMQSLFKEPKKVFNVPEEQQRQLSMKLLSELFTIATDMQDIPLDINLFDVFTREEMLALYETNNKRMTICNGNLPQSEGIPARAAITLWQNIEKEADEAIAQFLNPSSVNGNRVGAFLRFGHDINLYRLLSLLQLSSIHNDSFDYMDEVVPMAANLQMVFYYDGIVKGDSAIYVQFLHNERPVAIGLASDSSDSSNPRASRISSISSISSNPSPFYPWPAVKQYVANRIHQLEHLRQLHSINTMVGTAQANTLSAGLFGKGSEEHGQTLPAVLAPNGQNFWTPQTQDTEQKCIAPYYYKDSLLQGFRNSHWIVGGCTQDYGSFTVATISGKLRTNPIERATRFSHDHEISHPHYYAVTLPDEQLTTELTGASHTAMLRVTSSQDQLVHVIVNPNSDEGQGYIEIDTLKHLVYGYNPVHRIYQGWGESAGFSGHFVLKYMDELVDYGTFPTGIYLTFKTTKHTPILLTMASSFTDKEGALHNLSMEAEGKSFEQMQNELADKWIERLHTIDVEDTDTASINQFYGALYRASFLPREFSDAESSHPYYTDFSMWDTYRAVHPLYNIIAPTLSGKMMQSLVDMYERGGWLPIFPCWNSYTAAMIGDHCSVALADAYVKGIRNFDVEKAYEAMRKNAFEVPNDIRDYQNGMGRRALTSYLKYGYIPLEDEVKDAFHTHEQTSRTLEYAFDDFAVAQMAKALHQTDDYQTLMKRSENWRNVINPHTGWADGRHADGTWENNLDVTHRKSYITEGATCHYTWYVPHDIKGLFSVIDHSPLTIDHSSESQAHVQWSMFNGQCSRLDSLFTQGHYWHGNEPCHQIAYLFNEVGRPDLTQKWVRHILRTEYNDTPGGLSGNDDAGQMSAWYIFSSIGFYPVCPSTPVYQLGAPTFQRVTFNLENGKHFTIETENVSKDNVYVKSFSVNGTPLSSPQISHNQILNGSTLRVK